MELHIHNDTGQSVAVALATLHTNALLTVYHIVLALTYHCRYTASFCSIYFISHARVAQVISQK